MSVGGEGQPAADLGFGEEALVIRHMKPEFATLTDRTKPEFSERGGIRQARDISRGDDRLREGLADPGCEPLGEGDRDSLVTRPFLQAIGQLDWRAPAMRDGDGCKPNALNSADGTKVPSI